MYLLIIYDLRLIIPFIVFESKVLQIINATPSKIQPNHWAYIRGFEIICWHLEISPTIGVFFLFYATKGVGKCSRAFIGALAKRVLLTPYSSNYKN